MTLPWTIDWCLAAAETPPSRRAPAMVAEMDRARMAGPWIQTRSGRPWPLLGPRACDVDIDDIAFSLAGIARFNGHASRSGLAHPYSVAQHSVMVSEAVPAEDALAGLLHDAAEAYVGDCASPVKRLLPDFAELERISWLAIAERFGIDPELPQSVKDADLVLLATEKRDLLALEPKPWLPLPLPRHALITPWRTDFAEARFLARFAELTRTPRVRRPIATPFDPEA